jgi:PAS domain S-box-containing protein
MEDILKGKTLFLDLVQVAFVLTDIHSKILYANHFTERLFGYSQKEMEGQRIRIFFLEEDLTYFLPNIIYLTLYQNGFDGEILLKQKDGKKIFVHLTTSSFKEGGESFLTFSFHEIQRLKMVEREKLLMDHWASLGLMMEEIAHQIRNPIVSLGGYTRRLTREPSSLKRKLYLNRIMEETKRLERMIQRLEEVVLIQKPLLKKERILEVIEGALQPLSNEAKSKGISIYLETGSLKREESFLVDRKLITKALSHLIENSIDAMSTPSGKKERMIRVTVTSHQGNALISIQDQGEGIPKKHLDHLFDPFFSTRPDRIGLGLTFVKRVVEGHGGKVHIESGRRKGTTVTLILPMERRRPIRREWLSPEARHFQLSYGMEDNPSLRGGE